LLKTIFAVTLNYQKTKNIKNMKKKEQILEIQALLNNGDTNPPENGRVENNF
jgi:hypothetical protein